ncbi:hypothetical protein [Clostridium sp. Marseille-P2415]|uniref:hypothetical protein n=1 Tax=Clostridium sp. Marseille-P2415 TaxID=1805471 RepID=UPI00098894A1|nr:hypothetical protein [Clostridium sp. Marseille-P2415]
MNKLRKLCGFLLSIVMVVTLCIPASAAASSNITGGIDYVVYNQNGEIVEEGTIPPSNANYHWSGITLDNGWYTSFMPSNSSARGFYVTDGTKMKFSYTLNRSATMKYQFIKTNYNGTDDEYDWKSGTKTGKSATVYATADETKYYRVGITNASSDRVTLTSVNFTF